MQIRSNWDLILSWWTVCHELTRSNTTHNLGVISGSCQGHLKVNSINPQRRLAFRLGRWLLTYLIFQYMSILCEASGWRFTFCAFCRMTINEICPLTHIHWKLQLYFKISKLLGQYWFHVKLEVVIPQMCTRWNSLLVGHWIVFNFYSVTCCGLLWMIIGPNPTSIVVIWFPQCVPQSNQLFVSHASMVTL